MSWKNLIKILLKHWAIVKKWKWSHYKVKMNNRNTIIPVHSNSDITKWLLYAILKQLDILDKIDRFKLRQ